MGWFAYESLKRITQQHPEHRFYFLFDREYDREFLFAENVTPVVLAPQARHPFLYKAWFDISLPLAFRKIKPDLFLSPDGFLSLNSSVKALPVIHDLNFEYYPQDIPAMTRFYYHRYFPRFAKKATRIATVSEYSKIDLIRLYGIAPDKIDVVYNGANELFGPISLIEQEQTRRMYSESCAYFLFVGALHPRKNLSNLFKAFDLYKHQTGLDTKLLIVGKRKWWTEDIQQVYKQMVFRDEVIFTGRVSTEELKNILASALAVTYVSVFEGFGIPIVEGMYADAPVITSNVTSMPEVGGDAAVLVNPFSPESIAEGMKSVALDETFRKSLIDKGREQRKRFTWQKTADKLWASIEKTI